VGEGGDKKKENATPDAPKKKVTNLGNVRSVISKKGKKGGL